MWNLNIGKGDQIKTFSQLKRHWPLLTDPQETAADISQDRRDRWKRAKEMNDFMRKQKKDVDQ
jgi:hypothetical protein